MIIPVSDEYSLPGASDAAIFADILATARARQGPVCAVLSALDGLARESQGNSFSALDQDVRDGVAETCRRRHPSEADLLTAIAVRCYYRNDWVMRALDRETRPPFPTGFALGEGVRPLLNPVDERPEIYRKAP
jgi:hypothetical protein